MESIKTMSRKEKVKYINTVPGYKAAVTMNNKTLDRILDLIERGEEQEQEKLPKERKGRRRVPLGQHRAKMSIDNLNIDETKVQPRWINDVGGRIRDALDGGYQFVDDPNAVGEDPQRSQGMGSAVNMVVGTHEDGRPMKAYLMTLDRELYEEDQADKQRLVDEIDEAILQGHHQSNFGDGKYIPTDGIKIKN